MGKVNEMQEMAEEVRRSVDEAWPLFVDFLRKKQARVTQARKIVLTQVFSRHDHFCADDLAAELSSGPNHVSRGTVYRTLALMEEVGFVRVIRDTDVHAHYEHIFNHPKHEHMICDGCGEFIEFSDESIAGLVEKACRKHHFAERMHRVVVFGLCQKCQADK